MKKIGNVCAICIVLFLTQSIFVLSQDAGFIRKKSATSAVQQECDEIYMLLAYAVVEQNWQKQTSGDNIRGYNIGGVLVDENGELVNWARNSTVLCSDKTQHGEVRMLQAQLQNQKSKYVKNYTVYTTLEPCMMCSGMIIFLKTSKVIYGQEDPDYGLNIERLKQPIADYTTGRLKVPNDREKIVTSQLSDLKIAKELGSLYESTKDKYRGITEFLVSEEAHQLYLKAKNALLEYNVKNDRNKEIYKKAIAFYNKTLPGLKENKESCPCTVCEK